MAKKKASPKKKVIVKKRPSTTRKKVNFEIDDSSKDALVSSEESDAERILLNINTPALPSAERPFIVEYFPTQAQASAERNVRAVELERQRALAEEALQSVGAELKRRAAESGTHATITVTYRTKFGRLVAPLQIVIEVAVAYKFPLDVVNAKGLYPFPRIINGVPVKVREARARICVGETTARVGTAPILSTAENDIRGGVAIGSSANPNHFGTLGIAIPIGPGFVGTTNLHVAGTSRENAKGARITQPPSNSAATIGVILETAFDETADAVSFSNAASTPRRFLGGIKGMKGSGATEYPAESYRFLKLTDLSGMREIELDPVYKFGAASFGGTGTIRSASTTSTPVSGVPANDFGSEFQNVIAVNKAGHAPFLRDGDSGSALVYEVTEGGKTFPVILGLNFASDDSVSYAIPFGQVLAELKLFGKINSNRLWPSP